MGQYIQIGVCYQIQVEKEAIGRLGLTTPEVTQVIGEQLDLPLFDCQESETSVEWRLKESLLRDGLIPFVSSQLQLVSPTLGEEHSKLFAELNAVCSADELISAIENHGSWMLRLLQSTETIEVGRWQRRVWARYFMIVYFTEGKALLECYRDLFRYLQRVIALQRGMHPLAGAVKICLA